MWWVALEGEGQPGESRERHTHVRVHILSGEQGQGRSGDGGTRLAMILSMGGSFNTGLVIIAGCPYSMDCRG